MKQYRYLPMIKSPEDLKALTDSEVHELSREIRSFLVDQVTKTGGHLASNLGIVELTIAMHRVFHSPDDHFVFDVGHQAYVHKMLTGRLGDFAALRQNGGLSGFTKRSESVHDPFGAGHSSTSLSAAIGLATAEKMKGTDNYTVCVIGDGAYTGGMIHEALNNVKKDLRLIIILNENEMSISPNTGRYAKNLSRLRSTSGYYDVKNNTRNFLNSIPVIGTPLTDAMRDIKQSVKDLVYHSNLFEDLGLYYLGPADGNDPETAETLLRVAKEANQSVLIHFKTVKGKGWRPAEEAPDVFHAIPPMKYRSKETANAPKAPTYSSVFGETLLELMKERKDIRAITAAMADGTGLRSVAQAFPGRFSDVGIAEAHMITYAAGLSAGGIYPVAAVYSSFLQRAYDNLIHDTALQKLPMTVAIDRAGFCDDDGPTHHGLFDVAMFSSLPEAEIYTPCAFSSLRAALREAVSNGALNAVRYPKGSEIPALTEHFRIGENDPVTPVRMDFDRGDRPECLIVTY
ncbi:MAG: 1-deoxy-D-xylulose-5-phosphate synthase, partial [Clostridia bacterium]|nr:1-deoxy-D-xylulose-5-phosphate synthase [Clostridia bacterium]